MTNQVLMFSQPRTACHVLERMLSKQSNTAYFGHAFNESIPIAAGWESKKSCVDGMPESEKAQFEAAVGRECNRWKQELEAAEKDGQKFFLHTHPYFLQSRERALEYVKAPIKDHATATKHALVPDELLLRPGTKPFFVIRHPYLWIPSAVRATAANLKFGGFGDGGKGIYYMVGSLTWSRELFDWYQTKGITPVVTDAEDFLSGEAYVRHLCKNVGLNPDEALLSWDKGADTFDEEMPELLRNVQDNLLQSSGAKAGRKAKDIDLEAEPVKWDAEFGENSKMVRELVDLAMPHYEHLWRQRLTM
ncbi:hypothetical protein PRZ48_006982 [Zasmidium cellare]|uniref:Sulfotransferase n=1 Tax=Zasmidium cellare TaxID=395010 RepID=A0ABR0EIV4_ZASCE|nr:hypothetical protein PRZ48_006982 [Zasmidium cellare]